MLYASFGLLAIVIHLIIHSEVMRIPHEGDTAYRKRYRFFLRSVLLYYVSDVLWGFLYEWQMIPLVYADTILYFLVMGLTIHFWMQYIVAYINRKTLRSQILRAVGWVILWIQVILILVNLFTPFMFSFDEEGVYHPLLGRDLSLGLQVLLFGALSFYMFVLSRRAKGVDRIHYFAISTSSMVMMVFIVMQRVYSLLPIYAVGLLITTCIINSYVSMDERIAMAQKLGSVQQIAYRDPLTSVKNINAYTEAKLLYDSMIRDGSLRSLGVAVFDVNDLKLVNDTRGHDAGDRYLQESSSLICHVFKHSPVYRIGGDEFVAFLEGEDYTNRSSLFDAFNGLVDENQRAGKAVVAGGYDTFQFDTDPDFDTVFKRADAKMYQRKKELKSRK